DAPIIIDGHNDLLMRLWRGLQPAHLDLETACKGGFAGGFFALFAPSGPVPAPGISAYSLPPPQAIARDEAVRVVEGELAILHELDVRVARRADAFEDGRITA